jgi:hypothetical protein
MRSSVEGMQRLGWGVLIRQTDVFHDPAMRLSAPLALRTMITRIGTASFTEIHVQLRKEYPGNSRLICSVDDG